jgi:hypothetical protein
MQRAPVFSTVTVLALVLLVCGATALHAGAKLKINDDASIDLGFRLQVLGILTDADLDGDGKFESFDDFRIRRARFRLGGTVNEHFGMFFQTDVSGNDIQMIDAYISLKKDDGLQVFAGQHLAPANRQNITSSGTLLAMDRPGQIYKTITWGGRALSTFDTATYGDSDSGLRGPAQVRDTGVTVFGFKDLGGTTHLKYFVGTYDGINAPGKDSARYTGRLQLNFGDAENSYYSTANYLGKKNTIGIGASYDTQSDVGSAATPLTDYSYWSVDLFLEKPAGGGSFVLETAYSGLDLDDANLRAQGDGFYVQGGFLFPSKKWQVWGLYEDWSADAASGKGSYDMFRAGLSYFIAGHNANVKLGFESFNTDAPIGTTTEDSINSFVVGLYTTY